MDGSFGSALTYGSDYPSMVNVKKCFCTIDNFFDTGKKTRSTQEFLTLFHPDWWSETRLMDF